MNSPLIYPNDPAFWEIYAGQVSGLTRQMLPSTNCLVMFCDPLTGWMRPGTPEDLMDYQEADQDDDSYQEFLYG